MPSFETTTEALIACVKAVGGSNLEDDAAAAVAAARNGEVRPTNEARKTESGRSERVWELV